MIVNVLYKNDCYRTTLLCFERLANRSSVLRGHYTCKWTIGVKLPRFVFENKCDFSA